MRSVGCGDCCGFVGYWFDGDLLGCYWCVGWVVGGGWDCGGQCVGWIVDYYLFVMFGYCVVDCCVGFYWCGFGVGGVRKVWVGVGIVGCSWGSCMVVDCVDDFQC